jgi:hypothetical protein
MPIKKICTLDEFLICPCCNKLGTEENKKRWKVAMKCFNNLCDYSIKNVCIHALANTGDTCAANLTQKEFLDKHPLATYATSEWLKSCIDAKNILMHMQNMFDCGERTIQLGSKIDLAITKNVEGL